MANVNAIDPEGDVILVCGKTEFQVSVSYVFLDSSFLFSPCFGGPRPSTPFDTCLLTLEPFYKRNTKSEIIQSKVLSLASPVFKALFSPRFAEGQSTSSEVSRIQLHDDDAESLRFMCAVLHHKCASVNSIGMERLEKLAVATDKYDVCIFSRSIRPDKRVDLVAKSVLGAESPLQSPSSTAGQHEDEHMLTPNTSIVCACNVLLGQMSYTRKHQKYRGTCPSALASLRVSRGPILQQPYQIHDAKSPQRRSSSDCISEVRHISGSCRPSSGRDTW